MIYYIVSKIYGYNTNIQHTTIISCAKVKDLRSVYPSFFVLNIIYTTENVYLKSKKNSQFTQRPNMQK